MSESTIVLATSAPSGRPEYRRDFLTCIASPTGHEVSFLYQAHWWESELLAADDAVIGRDAVIVFCEREEGKPEFEFLPLRHAVITRVEPSATVRQGKTSDQTPITITFRLGALVYATDSELPRLRKGWTAWIMRSDNRPRPASADRSGQGCFVFSHQPLEDHAAADQYVSWSTLSSVLADCVSLGGAYFFRVAGFAPHSAKRATSVTGSTQGALPVVYPLETNRQYVLTLDAYSKSGETPFADVIDPSTTSDKLNIQSTQPPSAGRSPQLLVLLDTAAVSWPQIATLTLKGATGHQHDVPRVDFVTQVAPRRRDILILILVLACGAVLAGVSKDDLSVPIWAVYLMKAGGGLIVAVAGFIALRRAPGVGK